MGTALDDPSRPDVTWTDLLEEVLDEELDRDDEYEVTFSEFAVDVPMAFGEEAETATWRVDGNVTVSVEGTRGPLADWLRFWHDRTRE